MDSKKHSFKDWELPLISLRLQMENNAFLRVVLGNQIRIMEKLELDTTFPEEVLNDLIPDYLQADLDCTYEEYLKKISSMTGAITEKCWNYAQLKLSVIEEPVNKKGWLKKLFSKRND